ncbi:MAG TPA: SH3 domain-containing protein [Leptospiraceae bacterium]|nr:SH3 domain-containing protein [Leptospiraceae bacterium]HNK95065.1 SH3 domain-containing protein [Leptospiraceae bacterium]HNL72975.1 SH3 domain-containing protein [Leptospiraceae bacterium]HNN80966.1 SH3 domain-containing protein [Leptospiraceae bacterium]
MMEFIYRIVIIFFLLNLAINAQNQAPEETKQFRFVIAKTGLTLRANPDTESEAIDTIPFGKIVEVVNELNETVNVQGNVSNWFEVKYKWNKGYVVSGFLSVSSENPDKKGIKQKDYYATWKGDWKCGKEYSNLKIKKNGSFSGWLFAGGDDSGCGGTSIKGNWSINSLGEICLKTSSDESCFFIYNNRLIANLNSASGFKENYEAEILSGLSKVK